MGAAAAPVPAQTRPAPSPCFVNTDPSGQRQMVIGFGRSRYLSRTSSGGADDWKVSADGQYMESDTKQLKCTCKEILDAPDLSRSWPGPATGSSPSPTGVLGTGSPAATGVLGAGSPAAFGPAPTSAVGPVPGANTPPGPGAMAAGLEAIRTRRKLKRRRVTTTTV